MATKLLYLEDFGVVAGEATVVAVARTEDERTAVVLDQTCFYPRGGGQDWDTGAIRSDAATFTVEEVRLDAQGVVRHIGTFSGDEFAAGAVVACEVDKTRREINTRLHSAGHLVDMAVDALGLDWVPIRGGHYPHMSFVEYEAPDAVISDELKQQVQDKVTELAASTYENKIMFIPVEEMPKYCRHVPPNIPTNKPSRIVLYADNFGIPCGGTHVRQVADIGQVTITKIKAKSGLVKVSYAVEGIN